MSAAAGASRSAIPSQYRVDAAAPACADVSPRHIPVPRHYAAPEHKPPSLPSPSTTTSSLAARAPVPGFQGGCQWLAEHGRFVDDTGRHRVEIGDWHPHILSETAIGVENTHDLPRWTVAAEPLSADWTMPTGKINLSHHACTHQLGWTRADLTDKFVSRHPWNPIYPPIICRSGTNARQMHTHHGGSLIGRRCGIGRIQPQVLTVPEEACTEDSLAQSVNWRWRRSTHMPSGVYGAVCARRRISVTGRNSPLSTSSGCKTSSPSYTRKTPCPTHACAHRRSKT